MFLRSSSAILSVLAIATIAIGCGENEPDPLTKAAFIKQADSICGQAEAERDAALKEAAEESAQDSGDTSSEAELDRFVTEAVLPPIESMTEELDELGAPKKEERRVEGIVAGFERGIEKVEADPGEALTGVPFAEASRQAEVFGLTECTI